MISFKKSSSSSSSSSSKNENLTWSKNNRPDWVDQKIIDIKNSSGKIISSKINIIKMWTSIFEDVDPIYTAVYYDGLSVKIFVNRLEWKKLTQFQARNNLMLCATLPHDDKTIISFIDNKNDEKLASFLPKTPSHLIDVVYP